MRKVLLAIFLAFFIIPSFAQQVIYSDLKGLLAGTGDTVTTLSVEKRNKNQIYLGGGADYRIYAKDNDGLSKYIKARSFAVRLNSDLYINCKRIRYKKYHFGKWFAPAISVGHRIYFLAQPLGQAATRALISEDDAKLGGDVGNAIAASGLVHDRVCYVINPATSRAEFFGKEQMLSLLEQHPVLKEAFQAEKDVDANIIIKYLKVIEEENN